MLFDMFAHALEPKVLGLFEYIIRLHITYISNNKVLKISVCLRRNNDAICTRNMYLVAKKLGNSNL